MSTQITWLGHACFLIKTGGISVLIDPFIHNPMVRSNLFVNIQAPKDVSEETLDVDYILVTHGHGDHVGSAVKIMNMHEKTKLIVFVHKSDHCQGIVELCGFLETQGIEGSRMVAMNIGGTVPIAEGVSVTMVHAVCLMGI